VQRLTTILVCLFVFQNVYSQKPTDNINPSAINFSLIDRLFNEKLNELRRSKSLSTLGTDDILKKAAKDQADYMNAADTLTHFQKEPAKKTPTDRVRFYKGQNDGVGENCLFIYLQTPITSKTKKEPLVINTYAEAAEHIFIQWKNSPGHYKNMIEPSYDVQGLSFSYNAGKKKLFAAQVFGMKPYNYPPAIQSILSDYNIKPYNESYCRAIKDENVKGVRVSNRLYVQDNKVYFNVQNPEKFKRAFQGAYDMIAIDIVFKDQFTCEKNNKLNGSPYYDGCLLRPVSFTELFKRNTDKQGRLQAYVCDLPESVRGKDYQLNAILIKAGCFCSYTYPVRVESESYDLINLEPFWDTIPVPIKPDTFNVVIKQKILFDKSKSEISETSLAETEKKLAVLGKYATSVKLNAFSSIEGNEELNKSIQEKRAAVILKKLSPMFPSSVKPEVEAKENWDLFYQQIKLDYFRYLNQFNKSQIKDAIRDSLKDRLEKFLSEQRYAEFEIRMEGSYNDSSNAQVLGLALMKALRQNDLKLAHEIQSRLIYTYLKGEATIDNISSYDFPDNETASPFAVNLLAAKAINPADSYYYHTKLMLELFKKFNTNKKAQYNFCIYAINYWVMQGEPLVEPEKLFDLIQKCKTLAPERAVNSMLLNYHLAAVKYYGDINNYKLMVQNLNAIHDLFKSVKLDLNTSYKLGLYFSDYNALDWVVELLEPFVGTTQDERVLHLYLGAGAVLYQPSYPKIYADAVDRYIEFYPKEYKQWIDSEYQLLRENLYKSRFCK
jgi:uncharacterized protein YkwD